MVFRKSCSIILLRCAAVAFCSVGGALVIPYASFAQYPGSASNASTRSFDASSKVDRSSNASASSSSGSSESSNSYASDSSGSGSGVETSAQAEADGSAYERDDGREQSYHTNILIKNRKADRKRALVREFRKEFSKTIIIESDSQRLFQATEADVFLNKFANELTNGLDVSADRKSLAQDLALVRKAIDDRLDLVIASYTIKKQPQQGISLHQSSLVANSQILTEEIQRLSFKHELLRFGEYSLQAMGTFVK